MTIDLELKHFSSPLAILSFLNSEIKQVRDKIYAMNISLNIRDFFHILEIASKNASIRPYFMGSWTLYYPQSVLFFLLLYAKSSTFFFLD